MSDEGPPCNVTRPLNTFADTLKNPSAWKATAGLFLFL